MQLRYTIFLLPILLYAIFWIIPHKEKISTIRIDDLNSINLPENLQQCMMSDKGSALMLAYFNGKELKYYINSVPFMHRGKIVLQALEKIANSPEYKLQSDYYLIFLRDHAITQCSMPVLGFGADAADVRNQKVFLIPDFEALDGYNHIFTAIDKNLHQYPWKTKIAKVFWRGSPTGRGPYIDMNDNKRLRFLSYSQGLSFVDAGLTGYAAEQYKRHPLYLQKMKRTYTLKSHMQPEQALAYKYLIDIDGNSCSFSRMAWIMYSGSALFKHQSNEVQWYYDKLQPYVHYIPIAEDFSNLQEQFSWAEANQIDAQNIALNARKLAQEIFSEPNTLHALEQSLMRYHSKPISQFCN